MIFQKKTLFVPTFSLCLILTGCAIGNQTSATTLVSSCSLDEVRGAIGTPPTTYSISLSPPDIVLRGWLANDLAGESPKEVTIVIADSLGKIYSFKSGKSKSRPDVAEFFKKPGMKNSGFEILMENVKEPGNYTLTMQGKFKSDNAVCSKAYMLMVSK
jgi:hypothetical protein